MPGHAVYFNDFIILIPPTIFNFLLLKNRIYCLTRTPAARCRRLKNMDHLPICFRSAVGCGFVEIGLEIGWIKQKAGSAKGDLNRIIVMLSRLGGRAYSVIEGLGEYKYAEFDPNPDPDRDFDKI